MIVSDEFVDQLLSGMQQKARKITGCTPEQLDRLAAQDEALSTSNTIAEFEERMRTFDALKG